VRKTGKPIANANRADTRPAATSETMKGVVITLRGQMQGSMMKEISFSAGVSVSRDDV